MTWWRKTNVYGAFWRRLESSLLVFYADEKKKTAMYSNCALRNRNNVGSMSHPCQGKWMCLEAKSCVFSCPQNLQALTLFILNVTFRQNRANFGVLHDTKNFKLRYKTAFRGFLMPRQAFWPSSLLLQHVEPNWHEILISGTRRHTETGWH